jgi:hypothetical protein
MFNPFKLQNDTLERTDISLGAKVVMVRIRNAAGRCGRIQLRVSKICEWLGIDKQQKRMVQYYIAELMLVGLLVREPVKGHANYWIVTDVYNQAHAKDCTTVKEPFQVKTNVLENVICSRNRKPTSLPLVNEILSITGDRKSTRYWVGVVRKLPEDEIRQYLSHLNIAMNEKIINHPGAYLNSLVLANHPEMKRRTEDTPQPQYQRYVEPEEPVGEIASEEVVRASLAEIKIMLHRKAG